MLLILFSFNLATIFLYKYLCLGFNKSVFNWTFCSYFTHGKTQLYEKYKGNQSPPERNIFKRFFSPFLPSHTKLECLCIFSQVW